MAIYNRLDFKTVLPQLEKRIRELEEENKRLTKELESRTDDYIVEQGTENGWTYHKWDSGIAECWKVTEVESHTYANGASHQVFEYLPFEFIESPSVVASGGIDETITTDMGYTRSSTTSCHTYLINRSGSSVTKTAKVSWVVKGKWK